MDIDTLGGRRFILAMATLLVCSILRAFNLLFDGGYVTIIMGTVAAFITAGTWDNHVEVRADVQKTVAAAQAEVAPSTAVTPVSP